MGCLSRVYRMGKSSACEIVIETCQAIHDELGPIYVSMPDTAERWSVVVNGFDQRWNYPGCIGAIDGKHIRIVTPKLSGSTFHNYKGFKSVVLLAVVDANYEVMYADVGCEGTVADGGVLKNSSLWQDIVSGAQVLPEDIVLRGTQQTMKCHLIGDDAFAMSPVMLKPYAHRHLTDREAVYNYRCSRARRVVENCFGIMAARFRVLRSEIQFSPVKTNIIVSAICVLHNIMRRRNGVSYMAPESVDQEANNYIVSPGSWRLHDNGGEPLLALQPSQARNSSNEAKRMREDLADYFLTPYGKVAWQMDHIHNTYENLLRNIATAPR